MALRGQKPVPTHLKLVRGNPGRRPINKKEAKVEPAIPEPPPHLWEEAKAEWRLQCDQLYAVGLLTKLDRSVFGAYCQSYAQWARAIDILTGMADRDPATRGMIIKTKNGNHIQNPLVGIANKAARDMVRYAEQIGLTPSARSRIDADEAGRAQAQDPAEAFLSA